MRVPVLALTWSLNCPLSVLGKKSWPSQGRRRKAARRCQRKAGTKNQRRWRTNVVEQALDSRIAYALKAALKSALEANQWIVCADFPSAMRV